MLHGSGNDFLFVPHGAGRWDRSPEVVLSAAKATDRGDITAAPSPPAAPSRGVPVNIRSAPPPAASSAQSLAARCISSTIRCALISTVFCGSSFRHLHPRQTAATCACPKERRGDEMREEEERRGEKRSEEEMRREEE